MKATVVSLYPFELNEFKPGLGRYVIPPCTDPKEPKVLVIDDTKSQVYIDVDRGSLFVTSVGQAIAESVVNDFLSSQPAVDIFRRPALFFVPEEVTPAQVLTKYGNKVTEALNLQRAWAFELIRLADDDWAKYQRHRTITDTQRHFAIQLGLKRPWTSLIEEESRDMKNCTFCTELIPFKAIVCPNCRTILDAAKYKALTEKV